jgi:hypothetical protein
MLSNKEWNYYNCNEGFAAMRIKNNVVARIRLYHFVGDRGIYFT